MVPLESEAECLAQNEFGKYTRKKILIVNELSFYHKF